MLILLELGRWDEALQIAMGAAERYPEGGAEHALVAEVLWRQGRLEEAAQGVATAWKQRPGGDWPHEVAASFSRSFDDSNLAAARTAVGALVAAGVQNRELRMVGEALGGLGRHALAFAALTSIPDNGQDEDAAPLYALKELAAAEGRDAALKWLHGWLPSLTNAAAVHGYQFGVDDLLWSDPRYSSSMQLTYATRVHRALAWARAKRPDPALRVAILEESGRHLAGSWDSIAPRYMVREVGDDVMLSLAVGSEAICNVAWLVGTRKATEGDFADANDWFQVAMETAAVSQPPHVYSYQLMSKWMRANKSLERVQAERVLTLE